MSIGQNNNFDGNNIVLRMGEVINVEDPLRNFRVQVRLFGETDDKQQIPNKDLAWYQCSFPVTSGSLAGVGQSLGLIRGSRVLVAVFDYPKCQNCLVLGSIYPGESSFPSIPIPAKAKLDAAHGPKPVNGYNYGPAGNKNLNDVVANIKGLYTKLYEAIQIFANLIPR